MPKFVEDRHTRLADDRRCWHCHVMMKKGDPHTDRVMSLDGEAYHIHAHNDCTEAADAFWKTVFDFGADSDGFPPLVEDERFYEDLDKWSDYFPQVCQRIENATTARKGA